MPTSSRVDRRPESNRDLTPRAARASYAARDDHAVSRTNHAAQIIRSNPRANVPPMTLPARAAHHHAATDAVATSVLTPRRALRPGNESAVVPDAIAASSRSPSPENDVPQDMLASLWIPDSQNHTSDDSPDSPLPPGIAVSKYVEKAPDGSIVSPPEDPKFTEIRRAHNQQVLTGVIQRIATELLSDTELANSAQALARYQDPGTLPVSLQACIQALNNHDRPLAQSRAEKILNALRPHTAAAASTPPSAAADPHS